MLRISDKMMMTRPIKSRVPTVALCQWLQQKKLLATASERSSERKDYHYIQQSPVATSKFQASLPRMPIPSLADTCQRYLSSLKPLLAAQEFATVEQIVKDFEAKDGPPLDQLLRTRNKRNKHTSYINAPWTDMYLRDRRPLVATHNPGIMLAHDGRPEMSQDIVQRPANFLISSLRFRKSLKEELLKPEVFHLKPAKSNTSKYWQSIKYVPECIAAKFSWLWMAFPLDMVQYKNLLCSTRVPGQEKDEIREFPDAKHMLVMRKGHFYTFDAYNANGELFPPGYYVQAFQQIADDHPPEESGHKIGVLTTEDRTIWAQMRERLESLSAENKQALEQIDSALYCMCLDEHWEHDLENEMPGVLNTVMGDDPSNRWFDKSFSMIFSRNGACAINFEHAWGDGVAVMRFVDEVVADSQKHHFAREYSQEADAAPNVKRLRFSLDDVLIKGIADAEAKYRAKMNSVDFNFFIMEGIGKADCKKASIGPDSLMQTGFQIAYHRVYGQMASTYESCSTAIYKHGRTEAVRPCTSETEIAAKIFNSAKGGSASEKIDALKRCSKKHLEMIKLAAQGQGWDRHLFALKALALDRGEQLPALFEHPSYGYINHNIISTSTLSSRNMVNGGFVAVAEDGYGIGYQIQNDMLGTCTSNYNTKTSGSDFRESTQGVFQDIRDALAREFR